MAWIVQLVGDSLDLAALAQVLTGSSVNVSNDGQGYILTSDSFAPLQDHNAVEQKAEEIVEILKGAHRLSSSAPEPMTVNVNNVCQVRTDGGRDYFMYAAPAKFEIRGDVAAMVVRRGGTVEEPQRPHLTEKWTSFGLSNQNVRTVFQILAGEFDWVNLYRVYEIVAADVGGIDSIVSKGWASQRSISLFKHTANSPGALGIEARHGISTKAPPQKPMTLPDAQNLITSIVRDWISAKVP